MFIVIPNDRGETYAAIKKKLCIENPIPSQVITVSKVLNKVLTVFIITAYKLNI